MLTAPFPYFGGKSRAAELAWSLLGSPRTYLEPFMGSLAMLLARPDTSRGREIVNDKDGMLVNFWRTIQHDPQRIVDVTDRPVIEADYHAMYAQVNETSHDTGLLARLEGDPEYYEPRLAAYWLYVVTNVIGDLHHEGPWHVRNGCLVNTGEPHGIQRAIPCIAHTRTYQSCTRGEKLDWLLRLSARLHDVIILNGDWLRLLSGSLNKNDWASTGIFLDPPYAGTKQMYVESESLSGQVEQWCVTAPRAARIIICGYDHEHDRLLDHGWSVHAWKSQGATYAKNVQGKERVWASPACRIIQPDLFA